MTASGKITKQDWKSMRGDNVSKKTCGKLTKRALCVKESPSSGSVLMCKVSNGRELYVGNNTKEMLLMVTCQKDVI